MSDPPPSAEDLAQAERFTALVHELIEAAVSGSTGPTRCLAALQMAARATELAISPDDAQTARAFVEGFLVDTPKEVVRGLAQEVIDGIDGNRERLVLPEDLLAPLRDAAFRALQALVPISPIDMVASLHIAEKMVLSAVTAQKNEVEVAEFLRVFVQLKRGLDGMKFDGLGLFVSPRALGRGGDA